MTWKRMKKGVAKTPDPWELEVKLPKLAELKAQEKKRTACSPPFHESVQTVLFLRPHCINSNNISGKVKTI